MEKVIEFLRTEALSESVRSCRSGPTGKGHRILFVGKGASIDSTFWRGLRGSCQAHCLALLQVVNSLRDPSLLREDPVMSAITTFIEGEPTVCRGVFGERAQELDCVVSRYLPMLYKRALRFLGNAPDAEDAVQDALLSAYRYLGQFRGQAQLSTWLMTIVTNAALMQLRHRHWGHFSLDQEQGEEGLTFSEKLADSKPSPEEVCSTAEARNRLLEGVQRLSPKLRRAFQLRDIDGLTTKEAARALGVPEGTVKARLARARAKLAGIMRGKPVRQGSRTVAVGQAVSTKGAPSENSIWRPLSGPFGLTPRNKGN